MMIVFWVSGIAISSTLFLQYFVILVFPYYSYFVKLFRCKNTDDYGKIVRAFTL